MDQARCAAAELRGAFRLLAEPIQRALAERGFLEPTEPQERAIPLILEGHNVLLIAPTGTGKTEAAILPVFSLFLKLRESRELEPGIYILYITPLRALNRDLLDRLEWWGERLGIRVGLRHGDTEQSERSRQARSPPEMLITTPETLQAILSGKVMRRHLSKVRWVIVDEIHELAEDKRGAQLTLALERLRYIKQLNGEPPEFQLIGLSATIGSPEEVGRFLVGVGREVKIVKCSVARLMELRVVYPAPTEEDLELAGKLFVHPDVAARLRLIRELIEKHRSVLIFVNTRAIAEVLASRFHVWDINLPVGVHHGSLAKPSRIAAERGLKEGKLKGLIATSSLELGIDIGHVDLVIQYMSPRQVTRLVQRVGRSGHRINLIAKGVIITADPDDTLEALVICRRAKEEALEPIKVPEKPLDVLTHQIVALLMVRSRWRFDEILELYSKAYPFRELSKDDLLFVLRYMHARYPRLAWISEEDEVVLKPRNRDFYRYFFEELSMIPDEKHYLVIDATNDMPIGLLDEAFVAEYGEPGVKFVFRGSLWVIREIRGDRIYVVPAKDPTGAIPSWVGEEIPVPYEVAQEVGSIKRIAEQLLREGKSLDEVVEHLLRSGYGGLIDPDSLRRALSEVEEQVKQGCPVPSDRRVLIECWGGIVVIHTHLGLLGNRALAQLLAEQLAERTGMSVGAQQDPYRVVLHSPVKIPSGEILKELKRLARRDLASLVRRIAIRSGLFKRRLIHVARRFGALSKSVDFADVSLRKLVEMFDGTPIFCEAMKEFLQRDIDVEIVKEFLRRLVDGELEVVCLDTDTPTPMTRVALERIARKTELIPPERMHKVILEATKARLLSEARVLMCTSCWEWMDVVRVKDLDERPRCPRCGSARLALLNLDEREALRLLKLKGRPRARADERLIKEALESAELIERYGKRAAIVLAARGLTPKDAAEILRSHAECDDAFFSKIIEAERRALRRRFV